MIISLDYDGTFTKDPAFWLKFIDLAKDAGHEIVCVTMRYEDEIEKLKEYFDGNVKVICTSREAKIQFVNNVKTKVDIWIEDQPHWLFENALKREYE